MNGGNSIQSEVSVHVQISELNNEQECTLERKDSCTAYFLSKKSPSDPAPEKKLTLFALRLAVLEKTATGLGKLGFIWATVVLLGGFAATLEKTDFWIITIILLIEGARIFSRSHELEWQHQSTWSIADVGISSFQATRSIVKSAKAIYGAVSENSRQKKEVSTTKSHHASCASSNQQEAPTRTWTSSEVPLVPFDHWLFVSRNVSRLLSWLQILSAIGCIVLSLMKLVRHSYGEVNDKDTDKRNRKVALNIFYALALSEALLCLLEKSYWQWKVNVCKLLDEVRNDCQLGKSGMVSVRRFFFDSYSRCLNRSIFDGIKMDMVSFAIELLSSKCPDEQLIGVRILRRFSDSPRFCDDTLEKIGTNLSVMNRLVEMLNWKDLARWNRFLLCYTSPGAPMVKNLRTESYLMRAAMVSGISIFLDFTSWRTLLIIRIMQEVENILQEVMIGLAAHVFKFMTPDESRHMFSNAGSSETEVAAKLVEILKKHNSPSTKVPSIRRFVIELAIWMMKDKKMNMQTFKNLGLENDLESIMETTSDLESFSTFSSPAGLSRHHATIHSLVEAAMKLLKDD